MDGLQNKQAAAILGVHEGTASRRHEKALSRFQAAITARAQQRLSEAAYTGVLEDLQANPKLFGMTLYEALENVRQPFQADPRVGWPFQADPRVGWPFQADPRVGWPFQADQNAAGLFQTDDAEHPAGKADV